MDELEFLDIGVSAYKGANLKDTSAFGRFMAAVNLGQIEEGSYLLVESLDRLSRQEIKESLQLFIQIVNSGIIVVTLSDNHVYGGRKTDFFDLFYSMMIMSRAHEESLMKSQRVSAAWDKRREAAGEKIVTKRTLGWLKVNETGDGFELIPERVEVVEQIYELCTAGMGNYAIANHLTDQGVNPFGKSEKWNPSSVGKILSTRAVLGEYQPHKLIDGKSTAVGDPVLGYYPQVIDEDLFNRCQAIRTKRQTSGGGRKGDNFANLFSGLAKCGDCDGKLFRKNKGVHAYLVCENQGRKGTCKTRSWRYDDFETSFLSFMTELDLSSLEGGEIGPSQSQRDNAEQQSLIGMLDDLKEKREKTFNLCLEADDNQFLKERLLSFESEIGDLEAKIAELSSSLSDGHTGSTLEALQQHLNIIQKSEDNFALRAHAASLIKEQIKSLFLFRDGNKWQTEKTLSMLDRELEPDDPALELIKQSTNPGPYFAAVFKQASSIMRSVYPDPKDPSKILDSITEKDIQSKLEKRL